MATGKWLRERTDSKINTAKVAKSVLKNPLQTQVEIAKDAWVSKTTVFNKLAELDKAWQKDSRIQGILDADLEIITLWQGLINDRLKDLKNNKEGAEKISARDVSWIIRENTARYSLFKWDATDKDWWLKQVTDITFNIDG